MFIIKAILLFVYFVGLFLDAFVVLTYLLEKNVSAWKATPIALFAGALWPVWCGLYVFGILNRDNVYKLLDRYV
jgi:hypothetical protein